MTGKVKTNINTIITQARFMPPTMGTIRDKDQPVLSKQGYSPNSEINCFVKCDEQGRIYKFLETDKKGNPNYSILYKYNTNGDLIQEIWDYKDDGNYEEVRDYECKYNENNKLISHKETFWSKIRNASK